MSHNPHVDQSSLLITSVWWYLLWVNFRPPFSGCQTAQRQSYVDIHRWPKDQWVRYFFGVLSFHTWKLIRHDPLAVHSKILLLRSFIVRRTMLQYFADIVFLFRKTFQSMNRGKRETVFLLLVRRDCSDTLKRLPDCYSEEHPMFQSPKQGCNKCMYI